MKTFLKIIKVQAQNGLSTHKGAKAMTQENFRIISAGLIWSFIEKLEHYFHEILTGFQLVKVGLFLKNQKAKKSFLINEKRVFFCVLTYRLLG